MLLTEPPPSQGDLHFRILGFPVRVHPWFWLVTVLFGLGGGGRGETDPVELLIWVGVVFVSILVHELGHALMQRHYGGHPRVTLYGMGGLASCGDCDRRPLPQILISLAGPFAGFLLGAFILVAVRLSGHQAGWATAESVPLHTYAMPLVGTYLYWEPLAARGTNWLVQSLLFVNVWWGLVNLLPVYPLDGGRAMREICTLGNPARGIVVSLWISAIAAAATAVYAGVVWHELYLAVFFGYLAYGSYTTIGAYRASRWR